MNLKNALKKSSTLPFIKKKKNTYLIKKKKK